MTTLSTTTGMYRLGGAAWMLIVGQEHAQLIEIDTDNGIRAITFTANSEYLVSGDKEKVQVWRVEDGKQVATLAARDVGCLAVSGDGRWVAAGTWLGEVFVWNAETYRTALTHREDHYNVTGLDFSPDSTQFVIASRNRTANIWDVATCQRVVGPLRHGDWVIAAKYSPRGDRVATATSNSVRVYDSNQGCLLVDIPIEVSPRHNTGLLWSKNQDLFILSNGNVKQVEASTGSPVSERTVPDTNHLSCIALPQHGEWIAYSTHRTVTFWNTFAHIQPSLRVIQHPQDVCSIALSPDDQFLAIGGKGGKIAIKQLPRMTEHDIQIDDAVLSAWKQGRLTDAEVSLTETITNSPQPNHNALANRALIRAHLQHWVSAVDDAEKSINIRPSAVGYIARSVALIGGGKKAEGCRLYDFAFMHCHPYTVDTLLLIKAVVLFMAGEHIDAMSRVDDLIATVHSNSICYMVQAYMYLLLGNLHMKSSNYQAAIQSFERARAQVRHSVGSRLFPISMISGWRFDDLSITIRQRLCEALYAAGCADEGGKSLLNMVNDFHEEVYTSTPAAKWVSDFTYRLLSTPKIDGIAASSATLDSSTSMQLLGEWAKTTLVSDSWKDALVSALSFPLSRFTIYRAICEHLETIDRTIDASKCFRQMTTDSAVQTNPHDEQARWVLDFKFRCLMKLEGLGNTSMSAERHDDAISYYSAALSLDPVAPQGLFIKRSKVYVSRGLCENALNDANKAIVLDPLSPWGYERKHAALHKAGDYENAIGAFQEMLLKMSQSPDLDIRKHCRQYIDPGEARVTISRAVQIAIRDSPRVLINTISGRLLNKSEQAAAFESLPVFKELLSSMTTHIDRARIEHEVTQYYRYAMFSHKWEGNEPLFEEVIHIVVYDLEESITNNDKLRMFCKIVRDAGFHWAWSDTCCINKADHIVLQEALVSMFKWYQGSVLTLIFLRGVRSSSKRGDLVRSMWNTRTWTLQEYHASKVVRFYTEDWTLYMNIDIPNHKESPEIISEMKEATGVSARTLMALRPGLDNIREKLCLASRRETTLVEDAAYSLLGIFSVSLPVIYGEGDQALGRLLAQLLTSSGDTSILVWSGKSGSFNSCLPANITVFDQLLTSYIPPAITGAEMATTLAGLHTSSLSLAMVTKLYDRLHELPTASFAGQRMKLPCIVFKLGPLLASRSESVRIFRAQAAVLGAVEIKTKVDLSRLDTLYLIHPWINFLLGRQPASGGTEMIDDEIADNLSSSTGELVSLSGSSSSASAPQTRAGRLFGRLGLPFVGQPATPPRDAPSLRPPSFLSQTDKQMRSLQLIARLRQPFGALLLSPHPSNVAAYRRVAPESLVTVQVRDITSTVLNTLVDSVCLLDVL